MFQREHDHNVWIAIEAYRTSHQISYIEKSVHRRREKVLSDVNAVHVKKSIDLYFHIGFLTGGKHLVSIFN